MLGALTNQQYDTAFELECKNTYPYVDQFENQCGWILDKTRMENAARVLACPVKVNPPCWQHGRIIYSMLWRYLSQVTFQNLLVLDVGTAKGFSALCAQWALDDAGRNGKVISVDVIHPVAREKRNTVAEIDGLKTLYEIIEPWPEAKKIEFYQSTGVKWISANIADRINFAFLDGKHTQEMVQVELHMLWLRQYIGDIVILDDVQIPGVAAAMRAASKRYRFRTITAVPKKRIYAIGERLP